MSPKLEAKIKRPLKLREVCKQLFENVDHFVISYEFESVSIVGLKCFSESLTKSYKAFLIVQSTIQDSNESEIESNIRIKMDKLYFELTPLVSEKFHLIEDSNRNASNTTSYYL